MCVGLATKVKTLRLPEDVIETIEQFPGENFTDKFVAAARLLGRDREKLVKQLDDLGHDRQQKLARIADMGKFTSKYSYLQQQLKDIGWRMSAMTVLSMIPSSALWAPVPHGSPPRSGRSSAFLSPRWSCWVSSAG